MIVTPFAGVWIEITALSCYICAISSLPSRECGLKLGELYIGSLNYSSLPSRECGLKLLRESLISILDMSLPSRECGLK